MLQTQSQPETVTFRMWQLLEPLVHALDQKREWQSMVKRLGPKRELQPRTVSVWDSGTLGRLIRVSAAPRRGLASVWGDEEQAECVGPRHSSGK